MQAITNSPAFTGINLKITQDLNKGRTYLKNDVLNILQDTRVPATFSPECIEICAPKDSNNIKKVMGDLTKAGINFDTLA